MPIQVETKDCKARTDAELEQMADMKRRCGAVKSDITRDRSLDRERVQRIGFGDLMDEAPGLQDVQEFGFVSTHLRILV